MDYKEIISLLQKMDKKGLEVLYTGYGERLYGYAVDRWKFTEDEAWEVIYKTLETLLSRANQYQFESQQHFENFIYKVFKNNLAQLYRAKKRNEGNIHFLSIDQIQLHNDGEELPENISFPEIGMISDYYTGDGQKKPLPLLAQLNLALELLTKVERDLLLLRAQNFSYTEIARMLGLEVKEGSLKVKHLRAKRKLIELMQSNTAQNN